MHDGEDEDTINAHIAGMHKEMNKSSPNYDYLADSMKRTFSGRRSWIGLHIPSVKDVLEKYPALSKSTIVHLEFNLISKVQLVGTLTQAFQRVSLKIVNTVRKKRHLDTLLNEIISRLESATEPSESNDVLLTAAVCVLPSLVKERVEAFIRPDDSGTNFIFPTVTYEPGGSVFNATQFIVRLEEISIAEGTLLEAVATQIALYWAFDIVFDPKAKRSLDLICRAAHVDSGVSPTPLVRLAAALFE
ncbi:hypothetical protein HPB50_011275 [Hyalomma asiaticum]|uniref:Uncharacterized protein n=1 Tax=Hyalomma asiaticum TaxID=266040 RepID=A0ACB7TI84_HYAAI|nr:hypothetical protein HPB50_011275 [Hyalomma asiaticum]